MMRAYAVRKRFTKEEVLVIMQELAGTPAGDWDLNHIRGMPENWTAEGLGWSFAGRLQIVFLCEQTGKQYVGPVIPEIELPPSESRASQNSSNLRLDTQGHVLKL